MVHDCISPDILCVMGDVIRDHKTRETDKFKTFNTCLSNHTYNWFFPTICFYLYCNFDTSLTWLFCSYMKGYLTVKTFMSTSVISSQWEDVNFNWIGKQTLMPVQIGAATHKQLSKPSNMITQEFWANQNQSSTFRFLIFMKCNGFILTCCKQYASESYFSQHGKHWRKHHRGCGSGGGSLQVV